MGQLPGPPPYAVGFGWQATPYVLPSIEKGLPPEAGKAKADIGIRELRLGKPGSYQVQPQRLVPSANHQTSQQSGQLSANSNSLYSAEEQALVERVLARIPVFDPQTLTSLRGQIAACVKSDEPLLEQLLDEVRPLESQQHRIQPRSTTSVSVVGTDGGNNELRFDPFLVQIIRIVDSNQNELWLEVVTPTILIAELNSRHFSDRGEPKSPLGRLMAALNVKSVADLAPAIHDGSTRPRSPSWVNVYRELTEWAVLLDLLKKDYGSDTLVVFDGFLRSKVFKGTLFVQYGDLLQKAIDEQKAKGRNIFIVGIAKHSSVLARYRLALKLRRILRGPYPAYVRVPRELEEATYKWSEYARGREDSSDGGEVPRFVNGAMFFVKFGDRPSDAIWPVDIFESQAPQAGVALGYLVQDAKDGFPISLYPRSLQKAHEKAALFGFDMDLLQDVVTDGVRAALKDKADVVDEFLFEPVDPSQARYQ